MRSGTRNRLRYGWFALRRFQVRRALRALEALYRRA